jgi:hypothetical protein
MPLSADEFREVISDVRQARGIIGDLHEQLQGQLRYDQLQRLADAVSALDRAAQQLTADAAR